MLGLQFGLLLGGAAVTEAVFAYPGMGQLLVNAINVQDFPTIEATILVLAGVYRGQSTRGHSLRHRIRGSDLDGK